MYIAKLDHVFVKFTHIIVLEMTMHFACYIKKLSCHMKIYKWRWSPKYITLNILRSPLRCIFLSIWKFRNDDECRLLYDNIVDIYIKIYGNKIKECWYTLTKIWPDPFIFQIHHVEYIANRFHYTQDFTLMLSVSVDRYERR